MFWDLERPHVAKDAVFSRELSRELVWALVMRANAAGAVAGPPCLQPSADRPDDSRKRPSIAAGRSRCRRGKFRTGSETPSVTPSVRSRAAPCWIRGSSTTVYPAGRRYGADVTHPSHAADIIVPQIRRMSRWRKRPTGTALATGARAHTAPAGRVQLSTTALLNPRARSPSCAGSAARGGGSS